MDPKILCARDKMRHLYSHTPEITNSLNLADLWESPGRGLITANPNDPI
jgi:hypothetical protein